MTQSVELGNERRENNYLFLIHLNGNSYLLHYATGFELHLCLTGLLFAVIVKTALPSSSVVLLDGLIPIRFFPAPLTFADTFTSATGQPPPSVTVTVTTLLASFKSSKSPYPFQQFLPLHHTLWQRDYHPASRQRHHYHH